MNHPIPAPRVFANRAAAGVELGRALKARSLKPPLTVLGLPRGGVAIAVPVAKALNRREQLYRAGLPPLDLNGRTAILVDDGLATGSTMLAAIRATRGARAARIIAAAPVASPAAAALIAREADDVVFLETPPLFAISQWYEEFEQLDDAEVCRLLALSRASPGTGPAR